MYTKHPLGSTAILDGLFSVAELADRPSALKPETPVPAKIIMVPFGHTLRMRLLSVSAMKTLPVVVSTATSTGFCKVAEVAGPPSSMELSTSVPATVVIVPFDHTLRMRWLKASAMKMLPVVESTATPSGLCKVAEVAGPPSPLKPPDVPLPAQVMMVPFGHTWRMRWLL
jgi:hypothetical protein